MTPIKVTRRQYLELYFKTWALNYKYMSKREIKTMIELMFHNYQKTNFSVSSPFQGDGRSEMLSKLGNMSSSEYSQILGKLSKKGFLIKGAGHGNYALTPALQDLYNSVHTQKNLSISYVYEITNQGIDYDKQNKTVQRSIEQA